MLRTLNQLSSANDRAKRCVLLGLAMIAPLLTGCYDGSALVEEVRRKAIRTRLVEVDLGEFRVTMPRDERTSVMTEVDIHLFGEAPRYLVSDLEEELVEKQYLVHDRAIITLRELDPRELVDPDLIALRSRLLESMNEVLTSTKISSVGFYDMRLIRH